MKKYFFFSAGIAMALIMGSGCEETDSPMAQQAQPTPNEPTISEPVAPTSSQPAPVTIPSSTNPDPKTNVKSNSNERIMAPVTFKDLGIVKTEDGVTGSFTVTINTAEPITQINLHTKCLDASGTVIHDLDEIWQNIVKSKKQPIQQGQTYKSSYYTPDNSDRCTSVLSEVHFENQPIWKAAE